MGVAVGFVVLTLSISHLLGPSRKTAKKEDNFECGIEIKGDARFPVSVKYFLSAILFVLFDVEVIFFYPYAVNFKSLGWGGFMAVLMFVGFFLAGLVIHGGLQSWWIEPVLTRLGETPLFLSAVVLTAFNDNAAITYLASLVPGFTDPLKYAVVAGAVTGGGLTVIANAPNPAGQAILARHFPGGVSPLPLALAALAPTVVMSLAFMLAR